MTSCQLKPWCGPNHQKETACKGGSTSASKRTLVAFVWGVKQVSLYLWWYISLIYRYICPSADRYICSVHNPITNPCRPCIYLCNSFLYQFIRHINRLTNHLCKRWLLELRFTLLLWIITTVSDMRAGFELLMGRMNMYKSIHSSLKALSLLSTFLYNVKLLFSDLVIPLTAQFDCLSRITGHDLYGCSHFLGC